MNIHKHRVSTVDYLVVIICPIVAFLVIWFFRTSYLSSIIMFFIVPSVYLTIRKPDFLKKGLLVVLSGAVFGFIVSYFAVRDSSWWDSTIFPFRIMNGFPFEDLLWYPAWFYYITAFYDYFFDRLRGAKEFLNNHKVKILLEGLFGVLSVFLLFYFFAEKYLYIPYFYAVLMISLGIIPLILELYFHPVLVSKFSKVILYFFFVNFLHEVGSFLASHWHFPGTHYIGWVQFGNMRIPFEEFAFWMLIGSSYILTWYEHFLCDEK